MRSCVKILNLIEKFEVIGVLGSMTETWYSTMNGELKALYMEPFKLYILQRITLFLLSYSWLRKWVNTVMFQHFRGLDLKLRSARHLTAKQDCHFHFAAFWYHFRCSAACTRMNVFCLTFWLSDTDLFFRFPIVAIIVINLICFNYLI